ncbi:hypothetical protein BDV59DRAFT_168383 [Aspergillus ambiguus]|uniref:uncharacterized protein n=1 Tax=Aspergillus ambiguus TaxID=176160 RepID=UPI003CCDBCCF
MCWMRDDHSAVIFLFLLFSHGARLSEQNAVRSKPTGRKITGFSISRGASRSAYRRCASKEVSAVHVWFPVELPGLKFPAHLARIKSERGSTGEEGRWCYWGEE